MFSWNNDVAFPNHRRGAIVLIFQNKNVCSTKIKTIIYLILENFIKTKINCLNIRNKIFNLKATNM